MPSRVASVRPSAVSRSKRPMRERMANSKSGTRRATRSRTAVSPLCWRSSHGSMPLGLDRDEGLGDELLVVLEGAKRSLLPGRVAVEGEDDLAPQLGLVASAGGAGS